MPRIPADAHYNAEHNAGNPDPRPGAYYVSAIDAGRYALALGPFTTHARALELVPHVRRYALEHDRSGRASFAGYGTCRLELADDNPAGQLNAARELNAYTREPELAA